ncbi:NUDIX domain-containing protein [Notoacmeibacter ruber]|uniref:ADP-ribose pyrophosphatase n=1 Tax=Notoacmeibacter ruber TaxID=2670375 RepID=A0A3L7J8H5_9HYPH|nr:NUDIX domain-containing protein [Notoacmeibacter ruber]RLQ87038.1 NUDIX domain-containing protein [Notoacmeibacter ruber]
MRSKAEGDRPAETTITGRSTLHDGFESVEQFRIRHTDPDGSQSDEETRELLMAGHVVGVIAHDPSADKIVLIRQYRLAAHLQTGKGDLVELVAGGVENGETPEEAARRELKEEAGLDAKSLKPLFQVMSSPGITDEMAHFFHAEVDASALSDRAGAEEENEATFPFALPTDEAIALAESGECQNAFLVLAMARFRREASD